MSDKSALITGANRGIGLGLVHKFLARGDFTHIFAGCRKGSDRTKLEAIVDSRLHIVDLDVTDVASINAAADEVGRVTGNCLHALINNSGVLEAYPINAQPDFASLRHQFDVNTLGPVAVTQGFLPLLKQYAEYANHSIIFNISSGLGSIFRCPGSTEHHCVTYQMSKAALNLFTKCLGKDFEAEKLDIIAVAITPGWVKTDMTSKGSHGNDDKPAPGQFTVEESASNLMESFDRLTMEHNGGFFGKDLVPIPF